MIPYSAKHKGTKMRPKVSHDPIEETVLELVVGEFLVTDMKIFTMANIMVTRIPILPGFSTPIIIDKQRMNLPTSLGLFT